MSIEKTIFAGSIWAIAMRWGIRLIGLASVVVLARVLRPEDFGILAMAMLVVALLESFSDLGVAMMLIREPHVSVDDLDTAWTLRIIQGVFLGALVALMAVPAALYFHEPRVTGVIYLCAVALPLVAMENIGVVLIRKELDFAKDFRYQVIVKVLSVIVTVGLALLLRTYWALALAQPVGAIANVVTSYVISSYRPRFCLASYRRFLGFSANVILANVARFLTNKADVFLVGSIGSTTQMGFYNVASELSSMPPRELTQSVGRALFPSLAKLRNDRADVLKTFLRIIGSVAALCIPISLGLWAVADDFVRVVLGAHWEPASRLISYLAIYALFASMVDIMIGHVLIVSGHERRQAVALWIRCALLVACIAVGMRWGIEGIAIGATLSSAMMFAVAVWILHETLAVTVVELLSSFWRPTAAALCMVAVVRLATADLSLPSLPRLVIGVVVGITSYLATLLSLWWLAGRPQGAEASVVAALRSRHQLVRGA